MHLIGLQTDIENSRMDMTTEEIIKILNPLNFQGWHYLCKSCEGEVIANTNDETNKNQETEEENLPEIPLPTDQEVQMNQDLQPEDAAENEEEPSQSQAEQNPRSKSEQSQIKAKTAKK